MAHEPYREFRAEELILRDFLALDRTVLANQRTFLAYIRTSLAFLVTGAGFIKFFGGGLVLGIGWLFIIAAVVIFIIGLNEYHAMSGKFRELEEVQSHRGGRAGQAQGRERG